MLRFALAMSGMVTAGSLAAQPVLEPGLSTSGTPGLVEMPAALPPPDGQLSFTSAYAGTGLGRNTLSFQITPRLTGSFRYSRIANFRGRGSSTYDRSFALHYLIARESDTRPALAFGINDILGTGLFSAEYLVASKTLTPRVRVTGGLGWGRLAGVGGFTNPLAVLGDRFETRPARNFGVGGTVSISQLFSGDAALFGGIEYQATDRLKLTAEYSSDAYTTQNGNSFNRRSPFNFGATYALRDGVDLSAQYLYGSEIGLQMTFALDPAVSPRRGGIETAPPPVVVRGPAGPASRLAPAIVVAGEDVEIAPTGQGTTADRVAQALAGQGLRLHGLTVSGPVARIEIENPTYFAWAQAVGRAARAMTAALPATVETFEFVAVKQGLPTAEITIRRSDMEDLEFAFDNAWASYARTRIEDTTRPLSPVPARYPDLDLDLGPFLTPSFFDPSQPVRFDLGVALTAAAELAPGLSLDGVLRYRLAGNRAGTPRAGSRLPPVRTDIVGYTQADLTLPTLRATYLFRPGENLYGRVSAGYFEAQYGGASGEILWKPVDSPLGVGLELNYARKRDFDQGFGFRDYDILTGHGSLYYEFDNGFEAQLDAGRYLAGDWGATLTLARTFANGWKVGAFATLTDVPFDVFGEGSFDKGLIVTVPVGYFTGQPTRETRSTILRPITRDGGARLKVPDRLHDIVEDTHRPEYAKNRGRFWR